ncbi:CDP-glucose 4,6-dehydratase [Candidatus Magnetomoraceae bacterium gMMP-15]
MFNNIYKDKKVLITGHTGFKGSWLSHYLVMLGANVVGYSLSPPTHPNHYDLLGLDIESFIGDIKNFDNLLSFIKKHQPDIIFHLAAQSLVRYSYINPFDTFETNIMGTVNLFEVCRQIPNIKVIINVTSDKCYENKEWLWGYRENDQIGGSDPYSCSKACSELITKSYRKSFFSQDNILVASVRAGNVIGGGDWAEDRIIPDIVKAAINKQSVIIRNPRAVRPWQHVLDPLTGYLRLGELLLEKKENFADAWNFGPDTNDVTSVYDLVSSMKRYWNKVIYRLADKNDEFIETNHLILDSTKARVKLHWKPLWNFDTSILKTIQWYVSYYEHDRVITKEQIENYIENQKV